MHWRKINTLINCMLILQRWRWNISVCVHLCWVHIVIRNVKAKGTMCMVNIYSIWRLFFIMLKFWLIVDFLVYLSHIPLSFPLGVKLLSVLIHILLFNLSIFLLNFLFAKKIFVISLSVVSWLIFVMLLLPHLLLHHLTNDLWFMIL